MNKKILILALACCSTASNAHDFTDTTGGIVVASFDVSGAELWHSYFLPSHRLLAQPLADQQRGFKYINHPRYIQQSMPSHRLVCELRDQGGNDQQDRCNDEFPHVHIDDFQMAMKFANDMCTAYGPSVLPEFEAPTTFVGFDLAPASSHHYFYNLSQGLKFNCVALATE
jgi:hypothetical protein